jgi:hypothetical protein
MDINGKELCRASCTPDAQQRIFVVRQGTLAHGKVLVFVVRLAAHTTNVTQPASILAHTHPDPSSPRPSYTSVDGSHRSRGRTAGIYRDVYIY